MPNQTSYEGREILKQREGFREKPYTDVGGRTTVGYGDLVEPGQDASVLDHQKSFNENVAWSDKAVNDFVNVPLTQSEHDALSSMAYRLGRDGFRRTDVRRLVNEGNFVDAADEIQKFNKVTPVGSTEKRFVPGLQNRANSERDQFLRDTLIVRGTRLP